MAKIAKEQVWKELDPTNPGKAAKLVGADDHKPDKTYVLLARKGQVLHDEHLKNLDGVSGFFSSTDAAPSPETPKPFPAAAPPAKEEKPSESKSTVRTSRSTRGKGRATK